MRNNGAIEITILFFWTTEWKRLGTNGFLQEINAKLSLMVLTPPNTDKYMSTAISSSNIMSTALLLVLKRFS